MTKTALYRHFDASGTLLYVGITGDLSMRDKQHARDAAWHSEVASTKTEWLSSRRHARALEAVAIEFERPKYNIQNVRPEAPEAPAPAIAEQSPLVSEIEAFLKATGMGASYFGKKATGNSEVVHRLRLGRRCWPETARKIRDFIAEAAE